MPKPNRPDWLISHNAKMYYSGKRSQEQYDSRRTEEGVFLAITEMGIVGIFLVCPPLAIAVGVATVALTALDEYFVTPRQDIGADLAIEDIEQVFVYDNEVKMKGDRYISVSPELTEALERLAEVSQNAGYELVYEV